MVRNVIVLVFLSLAIPAFADEFYTLVSYQCDKDNGRVVISYKGAYNEAGQALVGNKGPDAWEPDKLIKSMKDENHIGELTTIEKTCHLSDGDYTVSIGACPGNFNVAGMCGGQISAWVSITHGSKILLPQICFESPQCHDLDEPIITQVIVEAGNPVPQLQKTSRSDWAN